MKADEDMDTWKILIMNWRDITRLGGAEIYTHSIAKRFVKLGHEVTFLCRSHPGEKKLDNIDDITIFRTGGKFSLYLTAFWNYERRLRNEKFDVVIESINGVPFFTPLYVKEQKIAIIYHLVMIYSFKNYPSPCRLSVMQPSYSFR